MDATLEAVPKRVCFGVQLRAAEQQFLARGGASVARWSSVVAGTWPALFRLFSKLVPEIGPSASSKGASKEARDAQLSQILATLSCLFMPFPPLFAPLFPAPNSSQDRTRLAITP